MNIKPSDSLPQLQMQNMPHCVKTQCHPKKLEADNILHCCQRRTKPQLQVTLRKFCEVWTCGFETGCVSGQTDRQTDKPVGFYGPNAPPGPNAPSSECPPNVMPDSERAQIPKFRTRSTPNLWTRQMSTFWTYQFAARLWHTLPAANGVAAVLRARCSALVLAALSGCRIRTCVIAIGADFKMYLLHQFRSNWVEFFLQDTGDTDAEDDGPEFWNSNSVIFENFLKFSKRRRVVPLRPIWTIMVAAKVDQSGVLVTKFRQNRLTLKGRSAGQTHTHTHTQTDRQDRHRTDSIGWTVFQTVTQKRMRKALTISEHSANKLLRVDDELLLRNGCMKFKTSKNFHFFTSSVPDPLFSSFPSDTGCVNCAPSSVPPTLQHHILLFCS